MSFGYSANDYVLLVQLAHRTFRDCQRAGEEYVEIACEVRCLHSVLRNIRSEAQRPDSKIFAQGPAAISQLITTAYGCRNVLDNLDNILVRYEALKIDGQASAGKKLWQKFRFGSKVDELGVIRGKLVAYISTLSVLVDAMRVPTKEGNKSTELRGEASGQFERMRNDIYAIAAQHRITPKSSLSLAVITEDPEASWQEFRQELLAKGFRGASVERHKHVLKAYMLKLDQSGILDQSTVLVPSPPKKNQWWAKKTYMQTTKSITTIKMNEAQPVTEVWAVKASSAEIDDSREATAATIQLPNTHISENVQEAPALTWDQESTASSEQNIPSDEEATESVSSSEAEPDEVPVSPRLKRANSTIKSIALPLLLKSDNTEVKESSVEDLVSSKSIVFDWLDKGETEHLKKKPQTYVRDEEGQVELTEVSPLETPPSSSDTGSLPAENTDYFPKTLVVIPPKTSSSHIAQETARPAVIRRRSEGSSRSRDAEFIALEPSPRSQVGQWNHWKYTREQTMSIDGAISIEGTTAQRSRHREGERRHISSRPPSTSSNWDEISKPTQNRSRRHSTYIPHSRPRSTPASPMRTSPPQVYHPQSQDRSRSYRVHSRSTPTSPIRSHPPSVHQYRSSSPKSKVHYRNSTTLIVDPPHSDTSLPIIAPAHIPSATSRARPLKSILKKPTVAFPEDPNPLREGVAAHKDAMPAGIPPSARWTKISRKLVNPEALEAGKERYEVLEEEGAVIILRVVAREEVEGYADITRRIRALREAKAASEKERRRLDASIASAALLAEPIRELEFFTMTTT